MLKDGEGGDVTGGRYEGERKRSKERGGGKREDDEMSCELEMGKREKGVIWGERSEKCWEGGGGRDNKGNMKMQFKQSKRKKPTYHQT